MIADTTGLERRIARLLQLIPAHLKGFVQQVPYLAQAYIANEMVDLGTDKVFNPGPKLGIRRGDLLRSLLPGKPYYATQVKITPSGAEMRIASTHPGASVQETGRPVFIKSKGRMEKFFWAKYIETRNLHYKILALAVKKNGGIRTRARPAFSLGMKKFFATGLDQMQQRFVATLLREWAALHG